MMHNDWTYHTWNIVVCMLSSFWLEGMLLSFESDHSFCLSLSLLPCGFVFWEVAAVSSSFFFCVTTLSPSIRFCLLNVNWRDACSFWKRNGSLVFFLASCRHRLRPLALYLASYVRVPSFFCRNKSSGRSGGLLFLWSQNVSTSKSSIHSLHTLISVGFGACASVPSWLAYLAWFLIEHMVYLRVLVGVFL